MGVWQVLGYFFYSISTFSLNLIKRLTENDFVVQDSVSEAKNVRRIIEELLKNGHRFVSFDLKSLFTSVSLELLILY